MSQSDSFIEEVTEEVRRDRLFALMRRYGWIAILAIVLLVGGAAWNEWRKANAERAAQETGDAMIAALQADDPAERARALSALEPESAGARAVATLLEAGEQVEAGEQEAAVAALEEMSERSELPLVYRQLALFKLLGLQADSLSAEERREGYESLIGPGSELRILAEEQLALIDVETGATDDAIERLQEIAQNEEATAGLRRRASQLIVALGGEPETPVRDNDAMAVTNGG
ncbi:MAG: hypothetical protein HLUCCO07_00490 [Rhodobacteraceae bacterium HLUCCO07]|nr:MAG: hypothetical protein HLUCCO07_00490 [Rhodobacteraceae bacterium HLUCCO07]